MDSVDVGFVVVVDDVVAIACGSTFMRWYCYSFHLMFEKQLCQASTFDFCVAIVAGTLIALSTKYKR